MKKSLLFCIVCLLLISGTYAQTASQDKDAEDRIEMVRQESADMIRARDLKRHLQILASDEFEGRETGTPGNKKAAEYIAGQFRKNGLKPAGPGGSYMQPIEFTYTRWDEARVVVDDAEFKLLWDFVGFPQHLRENLDSVVQEEVHFLGYGIDSENYSDYGKKDYGGKSILIYQGEPVDEDGISQVTGTADVSEWSADGLELKLNTAYRKGVKLVYIIADDLQQMIRKSRRRLLGRNLELNKPGDRGVPLAAHIYISRDMAEAIMGKKVRKVIRKREKMQSKGKSKAVKLKANTTMFLTRSVNRFESSNVVGLLEGLDPDRSDEYVIVTGHFDHLGKRGDDIYNGADDNGSGTSTIIELVESFVHARKKNVAPMRNVVFMLVTGEEKGLLGSRFYVENPIFPLEQTIVNVNVDMVGRVDEAHKDNPNYIYVIGADRMSTELHEINEHANATYTNLELDYKYNDENDPNRYYYRSDHYNFARNGIPAIFYFSGVHEDYHRVTDTVDKIMFDKMARVGKLIFHTIFDLANKKERIRVDVIEGSK